MKMITDYKKLLTISFILIVFSLGTLGYNYSTTGELLDKSIDFKGGTVASIAVDDDIVDISIISAIANDKIDEVLVRTAISSEGTSIIFESENLIKEEDISFILDESEVNYNIDNINIQSVGAALGSEFMKEAIIAVMFAFGFMGLIIFLTFKTVVPSIAIIAAATVDILFAMALMVVFGITLNLGTLAALLLLIGYSVDTDILLTTRLIKRKSEGSLDERIFSAMKTGITMTTSALAAFIVLYLVSPSAILDQISLVIIFGLLADYITTWFMNVGLLRWYLKDEGKRDNDLDAVVKKKPKYERKNGNGRTKAKKQVKKGKKK